MKTKIEEIQKYFITKLLRSEFNVTSIDNHTLSVQVEGYDFTLWTSNTALSFSTYGDMNFIKLNFTKEEREKLWAKFQAIIEENKEQLKQEKIKKLTKELETLKA